MQSDWKEIYRLTAERTGEPEQEYKDIGNFVFSSLYYTLRRPPSLIIKLKGIGTFHLRRRRMRIIVELFPPNFEKAPDEFSHPLALFAFENKVEIFETFKARLKDYDKYLELRDKIREERRKTQHIIEKPKES